MKFKKEENQKGMTLIELLIAMFILVIIISAFSSLITISLSKTSQQFTAISNIDQARMVEARFVNELRNATTANDGSYCITEAGDQEIIFYTPIGSTTVKKRIRYFINNNTLYKGTIIPSGSPLSYSLANEKIIAVQSNLANNTTPLFYYYSGDYTGGEGGALSQPVNINQIRFVRINLVVYKKTQNDVSTFNVTTGTTVRNLKSNLSN